MTEVCLCPIHGTSPVSGADCFLCKEEIDKFLDEEIGIGASREAATVRDVDC